MALLWSRRALIRASFFGGGSRISNRALDDHVIRINPQDWLPALNPRRDPWTPFRLWVALTIATFALRSVSLSTALLWPGAIPGWILLTMVLIALVLAAKALLFPGRVLAWREGEPGIWAEIMDDWRQLWRRWSRR